jgi:hypothetical protein
MNAQLTSISMARKAEFASRAQLEPMEMKSVKKLAKGAQKACTSH